MYEYRITYHTLRHQIIIVHPKHISVAGYAIHILYCPLASVAHILQLWILNLKLTEADLGIYQCMMILELHLHPAHFEYSTGTMKVCKIERELHLVHPIMHMLYAHVDQLLYKYNIM